MHKYKQKKIFINQKNMQCPSCGRPIQFEEKYAVVVACPYCNSILEFGKWELSKIGEQWVFIDFPSIFEVGKQTDFNGKKVYVKWQLRYEYDGGFFDKFFVEIDGKPYYIRQDDGTIKIVKDEKFRDYDLTLVDKIAWENLKIGDKSIFIQEVGIFKLVTMKWYVKNHLIPGREYEYLDGVYNWKNYFFERDVVGGKLRVNMELDAVWI